MADRPKIVFASDHAGFNLKSTLLHALQDRWECIDLGAYDEQPSDYPDFAAKIAQALRTQIADRGILVCGSGVGATVAANKFRGVRAALCHDTFSAHQGVEDDNANVLCLGSRIIGASLALEVAQTFLKAQFSGLSRHQRRVDKILAIERSESDPEAR